jgi:hypothetical protein
MQTFLQVSNDVTNQLIVEIKINNTKKKRKKSDLKILSGWLQWGIKRRAVEDIPAPELTQYLAILCSCTITEKFRNINQTAYSQFNRQSADI